MSDRIEVAGSGYNLSGDALMVAEERTVLAGDTYSVEFEIPGLVGLSEMRVVAVLVKLA